MKLSSTAIKELSSQYRSVLKKCFILNACVLMATAPAMAEVITTSVTETTTLKENLTISGNTYKDTYRETKSSGTDGSALSFRGNNSLTLTIENSTFQNNKTVDPDNANGAYGGAVGVGGGLNTVMTNVTMTGNIGETTAEAPTTTNTQGGAMYHDGGSFKGTNLTISGNTAVSNASSLGGALFLYSLPGTENKITDSSFTNNISKTTEAQKGDVYESEAGAVLIRVKQNGLFTLSNSTFTENKVEAKRAIGGAISASGNVLLDNVTFTKNTATGVARQNLTSGSVYGYGGAVEYFNYKDYKNEEPLTVKNSTFSENYASHGAGALHNDNGVVVLEAGNKFTSNTTAGNGGAIYSTGDLTITDNEFTGNKATGATSYGGAVYSNNADNKITLSVTDTNFENNSSEYLAGALFAHKNVDTTISGGKFENNTAQFGGAIYTSTTSGLMKISGTEFINNSALGTGAVGLFSKGELTDVTFTGNKATAQDASAGALFLGAVSQTKITGGLFSANESASTGGAIAMRDTTKGNNTAAKLDIIGTTFDGNIAATQGGAIYSTFYNSEQKVNNVAITGATFTNNQANEGGAIYNEGQADLGDNKAAMYIENSTFTGNTAKTNGGALFVAEGGTVELAGTNTFSGNKANGILNDIHNNGTLNVSGALTLDGGITGTGSVVFADNTSLTAALKNSTIVAKSVTIGNNVALNLTNIVAGTYDFINGSTTGSFTFAEDVLFEITQDGNKITATAKAAEDIASDAGVSEDTAEVLAGLGNASADNEKAQAVLNTIQSEIAAGNTEVVEQIVENINPTTAPVAQSVATEVNGQIMTLVGARLAPATGRSGGDYKIDAGGVWAKALYNRSKQDGAFRGYTQGIAMGIDSVIEDVFTLGVGYAYNNTDIKADARKTDVKGHNFFVYGEYQPSEWFVNTALSYSKSDYKEQKQLVGTDAKYNVETYGAQAIAGYDFANGLTPQAGLRYLHVKQDSHTDGLSYVNAEDTDLLTAVAGINYAKDFAKEKATFTPEVRLAATYDVVSDGAEANVVLGGSSYVVKGDRLPRFGVEAGLGLQMNIADRVDINVDYDLGIRRDYTSHTGTVSLKYNF